MIFLCDRLQCSTSIPPSDVTTAVKTHTLALALAPSPTQRRMHSARKVLMQGTHGKQGALDRRTRRPNASDRLTEAGLPEGGIGRSQVAGIGLYLLDPNRWHRMDSMTRAQWMMVSKIVQKAWNNCLLTVTEEFRQTQDIGWDGILGVHRRR